MRSLEEAYEFFCEAHEMTPADRQRTQKSWLKVLRPYGKAGIRALERLALKAYPFRPRLPEIVCTAEDIICPPADTITVWQNANLEARRSGPVSPSLHPAVQGALEYVGVERLRGGENPAFLKAELDKYVAHYNARPFAERAVLEGRATIEQIATLPSVVSWRLQ